MSSGAIGEAGVSGCSAWVACRAVCPPWTGHSARGHRGEGEGQERRPWPQTEALPSVNLTHTGHNPSSAPHSWASFTLRSEHLNTISQDMGYRRNSDITADAIRLSTCLPPPLLQLLVPPTCSTSVSRGPMQHHAAIAQWTHEHRHRQHHLRLHGPSKQRRGIAAGHAAATLASRPARRHGSGKRRSCQRRHS